MLQMKKNTNAKIGALLASALTLASIFGLVYRNAPATAADSQSQAVTAPVSQPKTTNQVSPAPSPSAQPKPKPKAVSRTHVS